MAGGVEEPQLGNQAHVAQAQARHVGGHANRRRADRLILREDQGHLQAGLEEVEDAQREHQVRAHAMVHEPGDALVAAAGVRDHHQRIVGHAHPQAHIPLPALQRSAPLHVEHAVAIRCDAKALQREVARALRVRVAGAQRRAGHQQAKDQAAPRAPRSEQQQRHQAEHERPARARAARGCRAAAAGDAPVVIEAGAGRVAGVADAVVVAVQLVGIGVVGAVVEVVGHAVAVAIASRAGVVRGVVGIALAGVDAAVLVGVLDAVGDAAPVGVGIERVGGGRGVGVGHEVARAHVGVGMAGVLGHAQLGAVEQVVVVAVGIERIDEAVAVGVLVPARLVAVEHAVVVAVGVVGIGAGRALLVVAQPVAVAVVRGSGIAVVGGVVGIALAGVDAAVPVGVLVAVGHAAAVGVAHHRAGGGRGIGVGHEVARAHVGVRVAGILGHAALGAVEQAVAVAVRVEHVDDAVAVRVQVAVVLVAVEHAVVVAVGVVGIRADQLLLVIAQAVAVAVARRRDVVGGVVGIDLAGVDATVLVGVLGAVGHPASVRVGHELMGRGAVIGVGHEVARAHVGVGMALGLGHAPLGAVGQAVVVAVGIEHVDQAVAVGVDAPVVLVAVEHAVIVAVGVVGIRADRELLGVGQAVAVRVQRRGIVVVEEVGIALAGVDAAVAIGILGEVGHAAVVGVGQELAGGGAAIGVGHEVAGRDVGVGVALGRGHAALEPVGEPLVVAVGVEHVDQAVAVGVEVPVVLVAVEHAVIVGVGVVGIAALAELLRVGEAVSVRVQRRHVVAAGVRIELAGVNAAVLVGVLGAVIHAAAIGVGIERIGGGRWIGVGHEVARAHVGVGMSLGLGHAQLGAVAHAVVVAVGIAGVDQPVAVGVAVEVGLVAVEDAVVVGIGVVGIGADDGLADVADAVAVAVGGDHAGDGLVVAAHIDGDQGVRIHGSGGLVDAVEAVGVLVADAARDPELTAGVDGQALELEHVVGADQRGHAGQLVDGDQRVVDAVVVRDGVHGAVQVDGDVVHIDGRARDLDVVDVRAKGVGYGGAGALVDADQQVGEALEPHHAVELARAGIEGQSVDVVVHQRAQAARATAEGLREAREQAGVEVDAAEPVEGGAVEPVGGGIDGERLDVALPEVADHGGVGVLIGVVLVHDQELIALVGRDIALLGGGAGGARRCIELVVVLARAARSEPREGQRNQAGGVSPVTHALLLLVLILLGYLLRL